MPLGERGLLKACFCFLNKICSWTVKFCLENFTEKLLHQRGIGFSLSWRVPESWTCSAMTFLWCQAEEMSLRGRRAETGGKTESKRDHFGLLEMKVWEKNVIWNVNILKMWFIYCSLPGTVFVCLSLSITIHRALFSLNCPELENQIMLSLYLNISLRPWHHCVCFVFCYFVCDQMHLLFLT